MGGLSHSFDSTIKGRAVSWAQHMDVSENSVALNPMVLLIIIPIKWL